MAKHLDDNGRRLLPPDWALDAVVGAREALATWRDLQDQQLPFTAAIREAIAARGKLPHYATAFEQSEAASKIAAAERADRAQRVHLRRAREAFERLFDQGTPAELKTAAARIALAKQERAETLWAELLEVLSARDVANDYAGRPGTPWQLRARVPGDFRAHRRAAVLTIGEVISGFDSAALQEVTNGPEASSADRRVVSPEFELVAELDSKDPRRIEHEESLIRANL